MIPARRFWRLRTVKTCTLALVLMTGFALLDYAALDIPWLRRLETLALDLKFRWRGVRTPGPETVIIMVDDKSIAEYGRWPMAREKYAKMVNYLHQVGARVIAFDILFPEPEAAVPKDVSELLDSVAGILQKSGLWEKASEVRAQADAGDALLARAIADAECVILPFTFQTGTNRGGDASSFVGRERYVPVHADPAYSPITLNLSGIVEPIPPLSFAAAGLGHAQVFLDLDGSPRYDYPVIDYDLDYLPSIPVRIVQQYLRVPWEQVSVELGHGISFAPQVSVPTDSAMRILVNYGGPAGTFPTYSFADVLVGNLPQSLFRDKIVLIGVNITGTKDTFQTPFTAVLPGVERMAFLVDSILHGNHITRPEVAPFEEAAVLMLLALLLGLMIGRLSITLASIGVLALLVTLIASGQIIFSVWGFWYLLAGPVVALVITFMTVTAFRYWLLERESRRLRELFSRYMAPNMIDILSERRDGLDLAGQRQEITVLFCDIHDFRRVTEGLDARALTGLINRFFTAATKVILDHNGTIDKYIRDGLMAFWNAPVSDPRHAELASRAALALSDAIDALNAELAREGGGIPAVEIGIGISTGPCTVGNLGSKQRFDYSALGAAADIGAGLEGLTRSYGLRILISSETAARIGGMAILPIDLITFDASPKPVHVDALLGDEHFAADADFVALHETHLDFNAAMRASEWRTARRLLAKLRAQASDRLTQLYEIYAERLADASKAAPRR